MRDEGAGSSECAHHRAAHGRIKRHRRAERPPHVSIRYDEDRNCHHQATTGSPRPMHPVDFVNKWTGTQLTERSAA